jgi:hypothetical protein
LEAFGARLPETFFGDKTGGGFFEKAEELKGFLQFPRREQPVQP